MPPCAKACVPKKKIAAAKTADDATTAEVKDLQTKTMAAARVVTAVNKSLAALKESAAAAKKAAELSKGTAAEKATADSAKVQNEAIQKTTAIAATLAARAKDLNTRFQAAQTKLKSQQELLAKVTAAAKPQLDAVTKSTAALASSEENLAKTKTLLSQSQQKLAAANDQQASLTGQISALRPSIKKAQADVSVLRRATVEKQKAAEAKLHALDEFVSFSDRIAPIFAARCISCHNARVAKGRFNMESFSAMLKGGESGEAIVPESAEDSTLFAMIEDGSMPKDADPLTAAEIALVKHWIDKGAQLNAGISDTSPLIQVMPRPAQPKPPQKYPTTIPITALVFSPDGRQLVTSGYHELLFWDATTGELKKRVENLPERIYDIQFSPSGEFLAVGSGTPARIGEVTVFRADDASRVLNPVRSDDAIHAVAWSPDSTRLAAAGADRAIRVFDVESGDLELLIEDHADWVMDIAWSADGTKLASASRDKTAKLFHAETGESLTTFNSHGQPVNCVRFLSGSDQCVSGGLDKQLRIWKVADGKEVRKIGGFGGDVLRLAVTANNQAISASADKTVRIHNLANGKEIRKLAGHTDWIYSVSVTPDQLAAGSLNGEVRSWNLKDGAPALSFVAAPGLVATGVTTSSK